MNLECGEARRSATRRELTVKYGWFADFDRARSASLAQPSADAASLVISRGVRKYVASDDLDRGLAIGAAHGLLPWKSASRLAPSDFRDSLKLRVDFQKRMTGGTGRENHCCKRSSQPCFHTAEDVR